mgnify:CR=1 FL=1
MDAIETTVALPIEETEALVLAALAANGFGVLTEIDIAATFKAKLDLDRPPLKILGACNPGFANRALEADPSAGLLLPCNVVLEAVEDLDRERSQGGHAQLSPDETRSPREKAPAPRGFLPSA